MKIFSRISIFLLSLTLMLSLSSCSILETEEGNAIKMQCEVIIDAILANDSDTARGAFADVFDNDDGFAAFFEEVRGYISGVTEYELRQIGWHSQTNNGVSTYSATFEMTTNVGLFVVEGETTKGYEGLTDFSIASDEDLNPSYTGTVTTLGGANVFQWLFMLFSVACLAFAIWMVIDCSKRDFGNKALWILIIVLINFAVTLSLYDGSFDINYSVLGLVGISYSYLKIYATGDFVLRISLPLGAIVYFLGTRIGFIGKKKEASPNNAEAQPPAAVPETLPKTVDFSADAAEPTSEGGEEKKEENSEE